MTVDRSRFQRNLDDPEVLNWLRRNQAKLLELFSSRHIRDFVFEPFTGVFEVSGTPTEQQVRTTIAGVALANAVMAGLPGKLGIGVAVAIALELYMAFRIARHLGYNLSTPQDARDSLGAATAAALTVFVLFKEVLGFFFSLFNTVGALPATFLAEYAATTLVGVLLWVGFEAGREKGQFWLPHHLFGKVINRTRQILKHHYGVLRAALTLFNVRVVGERLKAYLRGDIALDKPALRGDLFVPVAMAYLLVKETERLDGPMGELFIESIRQAWPDLADASIDEIANHMRTYTTEQLQGVMSLIKGQLFERMVVLAENTDSDAWHAELHTDRSMPGSDMVMTNEQTGEQVEASIKATMNPEYIEAALLKYPDVPIYATDEVLAALEHTGAVHATGITHADLVDVTNENFNELVERLPSPGEAIAGGLTVSMFLSLYPFLVAYLRNRISQEQLSVAVTKVTGETATKLVSRLIYAAALGPVFGWFLLARGAMLVNEGIGSVAEPRRVRRIVYEPGQGIDAAIA